MQKPKEIRGPDSREFSMSIQNLYSLNTDKFWNLPKRGPEAAIGSALLRQGPLASTFTPRSMSAFLSSGDRDTTLRVNGVRSSATMCKEIPCECPEELSSLHNNFTAGRSLAVTLDENGSVFLLVEGHKWLFESLHVLLHQVHVGDVRVPPE